MKKICRIFASTFAIILLVFASLFCFTGCKSKTYSVTYTSLEEKGGFSFVYLHFASDENIEIKTVDFAASIGGAPIKADSIYAHSSLVDYSVVMNETIEIRFDCKLDELDKPYKFYYKGVELPLGRAISFNK